MELAHREFLKSEQGRKWFIEKTLEVVPENKNWQHFHTPYDFCEKMISKTTLEGKNILVLFNVEFLEVLIHKFGASNNNITFLADCNLESEIATKIYNVDSNIIDDNNIDRIQKELKKLKKFDLCFSNPPYGKNSIDIKILKEIFKTCKEMVSVNSIRWALYSNPNSHEKLFIDDINLNIKSIEIINPNDVFENEGSSVRCAILHLQKEKNDHSIEYSDLEGSFIASDLNEITRFGSDWKFIYDKFVNKIKEKEPYPKLINHIIKLEKNYNKNKFYVQLATATGTASSTNLEKDDYFTLIPKNLELSKSIRKDTFRSFVFDNVSQQENFINYLKNDFVRFCVAIYKVTLYLKNKVELQLIPWMNFNEEWNDEKLYKHFDIDSDTIKYIENFLPDYYGIREKGIKHDL